MHTRQQSHFASNLPDLIERPPITTPPLVQNVLAEIFLPQTLESPVRQNSLLFVVFRNRRDNLVLQRIHQMIAVLLRMLLRIDGIVQAVAILLRNLFVQPFIKWQRRDNNLPRVDLLIQLLYRTYNFFYLRMPQL